VIEIEISASETRTSPLKTFNYSHACIRMDIEFSVEKREIGATADLVK